jgi:hypothetical protein
MGFDLSQYETVDSRIKEWYSRFEDARIETELVHFSDTQFIFKASVYKNLTDDKPVATGWAEEKVGSNNMMKNFLAEVCETSAIGRALQNANISTRKDAPRPSREEMQRVIDKGEQPLNVTGGPMARAKATEKQIGFAISMLKEIAQRLEFSFEDVMKWACEEYKCKTLEDFSMKQISHFIADLQKTKQQGESSVFYNLVRAKKGADYDPWATPNN